MPMSDTAMQYLAGQFTARYGYAATFTDAPNATGTTNEGTATRKPITWGAATGNGDFDIAASIVMDDGAPNEAAKYVGVFSAASGGEFGGAWPTPATSDQAFNASGVLTIDNITQDGTST